MKGWFWWMIVGVISLVGGVLALINPFAATVTAQQLVGWIALLAGITQAVAIFQADGWNGRLFALAMTALFLFLGWSILAHPLAAIVSLTLTIALLFLASGIFKALFSFALRGTGFFWTVLLSGLASAIFGFMVLSNFPQSATIMLGVLLAVELISNGVSLIAFALFTKNNFDRFGEASST